MSTSIVVTLSRIIEYFPCHYRVESNVIKADNIYLKFIIFFLLKSLFAPFLRYVLGFPEYVRKNPEYRSLTYSSFTRESQLLKCLAGREKFLDI